MRRSPRNETDREPPSRGPQTHVIILDGTLASLEPSCRTNAGRTYALLRRMGRTLSLYYEPGLQWSDLKSGLDVLIGRGINRQIRRAYGWLASRYRPGDRIYLFGYSRGAYAVRSLAGAIDQIGLLRAEAATERHVREVYRHYRALTADASVEAFRKLHCHARVEIEMIGAWDTVKSLGLNAPFLWRLSEPRHAFHNHDLSGIVKHGYHALAHDETRVAFAPVLWNSFEEYTGRVEQVWFPGSHGDIGGQLSGFEAARQLSNIPLVWMLDKAEASGLPLPEGWRKRYPQDPAAPTLGTFRGKGRILVSRRRRKIGADPSESLHPSIAARAEALRQTGGGWSLMSKGAS